MPTFVPSGTARLAVDVVGDGPPVVFLHAGVTDRRSWTGVIELLPGARAVGYDRLAAPPVGERLRAPAAANRLGSITVPVVVLVGDLDEEYSQASSAFIADTVPGADLRRLRGVAHLPQLEQPEVVAEAVTDVLARVE